MADRIEGVATKHFYKGDKDSLVVALFPLIEKANFISYHEETTSKLNKHQVYRHAAFIRTMYPLQNNLAFPKRVLTVALEDIARRRRFFGDGDERTLREWSAVCCARLRCLFRHYCQAVLKSRGCRASWVRLVMDPPADTQAGPLETYRFFHLCQYNLYIDIYH